MITSNLSAFAIGNTFRNSLSVIVLGVCLLILSACEHQVKHQNAEEVPHTEYPESVYWGDTHLHTSNSVDAFGFGTRLDVEQALRFARGEEVTSSKGMQAKLSRPLDFLVISDHSDGLGATKQLYEAPRFMIRDETLLRWWDTMHESEQGSLLVTAELIDRAGRGDLPEAMLDQARNNKRTSKLWKKHNKTVDRYNEPGKFSAFVGFEYTPMPEGNNLHRVVMFRDGADKTDTIIPFPGITNPDPESLWAWMKQYEQDTGGQVLAMPHNSNISNGLMFAMTRFDGSPIDRAYAETRAKFEPVVEVTQIKGDSESHPFLSPNDEFASYGVAGWDACNLSCQLEMPEDGFAGSYVREALKRGLAIEKEVGANPYAFGLIGATDSHTSLATADENNFYGKHTGNEFNVPDRAITPQNLGTRRGRFGWHYLASGYAGVWATANTREAIFDAFKRREVYATTGPRMKVRFFGGLDLEASDMEDSFLENAYQKGVPMGGEISGKVGASPSFLVSATMDPESANLDRIQIVKGWVDESGATHEQVYDVVWSDQDSRVIDENGKVPAVGNTVDLASASWKNSIGAASLSAFWQDPNYDSSVSAFYYVRVLEIPTPTWPVYDAFRYGTQLSDDVIKIQQERAYTSPIWLKPDTQG